MKTDPDDISEFIFPLNDERFIDNPFVNGTCYEGVYVAKIIYRDLEGIEYVKYQQFTLMR